MERRLRLSIGNAVFETAPGLSYGDYDGDGSVGLANIRWIEGNMRHKLMWCSNFKVGNGDNLEYDCRQYVAGGRWEERPYYLESPDEDGFLQAVILEHRYSGLTAYIRVMDDDEEVECLSDEDHDALELCQQVLSGLDDYPVLDDQIVSEVEHEWLMEALNDWLLRDLINSIEDERLREKADELGGEDLFHIFCAAMEEMGEYPTTEYNGVHVDVDAIKDAFEAGCRAKLEESTE